jgi:hypothetical protein
MAMAVVGLSALPACVSQSDVGVGGGSGGCVGPSCKHASSGGASGTVRTSASGSSSGGASSGGSSSSFSSSTLSGTSTGGSSTMSLGGGSSSGESDQLFTCSGVGGYSGDGGFVCGDGGWFASEIIDLDSCNPLGGVAVQAIGSDGVPISGASATSDATTGIFTACVPGQEAVTMSFSLTGYPLTYYQESLGTIRAHDIGMLDNNVVSSVIGFIPGGLNLALGTIVVFFSTSGSGCPIDNWTLELETADGGAVPDGGASLIYMGPTSLPDPSLTSTSGSGIAIVYDVDTTQTNYFKIAATHPDAGYCATDNPALGFTGRLYVNGGALTYQIINL